LIQNLADLESNLKSKLEQISQKFGIRFGFDNEEDISVEENEYIVKFCSRKRRRIHIRNSTNPCLFKIFYEKILSERPIQTNFKIEVEKEFLKENGTLIHSVFFPQNSRISIDTISLPKFLKIKGSNIKCKAKNSKKNVYFVFANEKLEKISFNWKIRLDQISKWVAFGICNKEILYNQHKFTDSEADSPSNHCCLAITTGGFIWNGFQPEENNKKLLEFPPKIEIGGQFDLSYSLESLVIKYENTYSLILPIPDAFRFPKENFSPFIALNPDCEVTFL
jgi:hypothetical protein